MPGRSVVIAACAFLALGASGCGTIVNHSEPGSYFNYRGGYPPYRPFGGALVATDGVVTNIERVWDYEKDYEPLQAAAVAAAFLFIDLPLSAVADTILLPFDVVNTILGRGRPPEGGWPLLHKPQPETTTASP
jgi:uncharacterized protein YceK